MVRLGRPARAIPKGASGFTLLELIIVITILGLVAVMVTANGMPVSPANHARAAAQAIAGALRGARGEALASDRSVFFAIDVANRTYTWGGRQIQNLPADVTITLLTGRDQVSGAATGQIRFDPDGGSSGGRVSILGGDRLWMVGVDWLTGRVTIAQK